MSKFIMMCGLPASGKSTVARKLADQYEANIHSSDELRKELFGDESENSKNDALFQELHRRIKQDLSIGKNVIYDATNIHYKRRKAFLEEIAKYGCEKICYLIAAPYETCQLQNEGRECEVPECVIRRMYTTFYIPQKYEGWDDIQIIWNMDEPNWSISELINYLDGFDQDNPHHELTLGQHLQRCLDCIDMSDYCLSMAALLHDIGKPFTKTFRNKKGELSDVAHYYDHHLVGAYNALFYLKSAGVDDEKILEISNYIQWHMQLYFIETEKAKEKFIRLVGQDFYDKLMLLHQADKAAH